MNNYPDSVANPQDILPELFHDRIVSKDVAVEKLPISQIDNTLDGKYEFLLDNKLEEFSFNEAEAIQVINTADQEQEYYGYFLKRNLPCRIFEIVTIDENFIPNLITPKVYGILTVKKIQEFGLVSPKQKGESLKSLIKKGRIFSHKFCMEKLIPTLAKIITSLHRLEILHGNINPNNIYIDENDNVILGECFSSVCGSLQSIFYETADRGQCHRFGKNNLDYHSDYYALGMTLFSAVSGMIFEEVDVNNIVSRKLNEGTWNVLNELYLVAGELGDIIRALVIDDKKLRWGAKELLSIDSVSINQAANIFDRSFLSRPIIFKDKEFFSKAALAHQLSIHWQEAKTFVKQDSIHKWLDISSKEQPLVQALEKLKDSLNKRGAVQSIFAKDEEYLIKVIMLLDPEGPFRYKGIAFYLYGLGPLLAYSVTTGNNDVTQFIANALFSGIFSFYKQLAEIFDMQTNNQILPLIEKCSDGIRRAGQGYGIDRCLYDLNPSLPCLSHIVANILCYDLVSLFDYLENNKISVDDILSRKNILCFVASKIGLHGEVVIENLKALPELRKSREFTSLALLALGQKKARVGSLNHFCLSSAAKIKALYNDYIKSSTIKNMLFNNIDKITVSGNLDALLTVASNPNYLAQDIEGLEIAIVRSQQIAQKLSELTNVSIIEALARKKGLKIAINLGYIVSCFSIVVAIFRNL